MKKEFNQLNASESEEFLRHFLSLIDDSGIGIIKGSGTSGFIGDKFIKTLAVNFEYKNRKLFIDWKIVQKNGILISIENLNDSADGELDKIVSEILCDVLERVIGKKRNKFYFRHYFRAFCSAVLAGEYWIDSIRFAPLFPDDDCHLINSEKIFVIDQEAIGVNRSHALEVASEKASAFISKASFLMNIGFDELVDEHRYFLDKELKPLSMKRAPTLLVDNDRPESMPRKGEICQQLQFGESIFEVNMLKGWVSNLEFPKETRVLFRAIKNASDDVQMAFESACVMYHLALVLGINRPTVRASYLYGAVDAIVKTNKAEYDSFTKFMVKYASADPWITEFMHSKVRSAHWHSGKFPLGERNFRRGYVHEEDTLILHSLNIEIPKLARKAIVSWLGDKLGALKAMN